MHLHFLGICGTFMGSLALLAREMGHKVTGCDANVYPPMSTQLEQQGIGIYQGYGIEQFQQKPDLVIIGNAMSRGNEAVEYVLNESLPYTSGPQWLSDNVLRNRWVLAVAGTHGKTTTSSMLAWILESAGLEPGFLIGGVPSHFATSARLGSSEFFVIEADEYDTAFFDKRSKFVHYHPRTLVMNNLEFDHADIFPDIAAIQTQFHHLLRIVPKKGIVIYPANEKYLCEVVAKGCWSQQAKLQGVSVAQNESNNVLPELDWLIEKLQQDGSRFRISSKSKKVAAEISWPLIGDHNLQNGFSACVAAHHVGVSLQDSAAALSHFKNSKRRFEKIAEITLSDKRSVFVYDDFAHHPTAIKTTLSALRASLPDACIIACIEPRSNTMKIGAHGNKLKTACEDADLALWYLPETYQHLSGLLKGEGDVEEENIEISDKIDRLIEMLLHKIEESRKKDIHIIIMSNGSFEGIHDKIINQIRSFPSSITDS